MAVEAAGSQVALASFLRVSEAAVSGWVRRGWVPAQRAVELERKYGVPRAQMLDPKLLSIINGV